ncbi:MAG: F420-0:Gamma-glutamyl ligase [Firmicutes bacterium]|nr:F420-0:Gamma-glutamyl ligase [Bacillota bacterium]
MRSAGNSFYARLPLRTHLVTEREDLVETVARYTAGLVAPGDAVILSESMVAIAQGRAVLSSSVRPGGLARILCRFPQKHGSLATPQAMQLAIEEVGVGRILLGVLAAGIGRLFGRRGWFYLVAGRELALIDDIAGTLPPYDRHVVLGPKEPQRLVEKIKEKIGAEVAIVDVNDLGCVDVIAATAGIKEEELRMALADNPAGNDDEQTPIVVLKRRKGRV